MRRRPALAMLVLALGGVGTAHAVQDCELDGARVDVNNGAATAGKTGLIRCRERDTGQIQREQELRNGVYMGLVRTYQEGRLFKEYHVNARGNMEGPAREFAPASGKLVRESVYVDSNEAGLIRAFYPDGQRLRVAFNGENGRETANAEFTRAGQLSDLRCGDRPVLAPAFDDARACGFTGGPSQVELFDGKGTVRRRVAYAAGQRTRWESLYDNGQVESSGEIAGTQSVGRRFWPGGAKRSEVFGLVTAGNRTVRQRELEYSERGTLVREQRWSADGVPTHDDSYYLNGQPRSKSVFSVAQAGGAAGASAAAAARVTDIAEFHDNGQRASQGRFRTDGRYGGQQPVGLHQRFSPEGKLAAEATYDDRSRIARERTFDENGRLTRDDEVFEDGSRKAYAR